VNAILKSLYQRPWNFLGAQRPQGAIYLEGVKKDMSVLRKRSPWVVPAASLLLGALTWGLAGCGGGGGDEFPTVPPGGTITLPSGVTPQSTTASSPVPVVKGQGATITATADPDAAGGITDLSIAIPPGSIQEDGTLGVEVVPTAQSLLQKAGNNPHTSGINPVVELQFGPVDSNGLINTSRPIVFGAGGATLKINQRGGEYGRLVGDIRSGKCVLRVRRYVAGQGLVAVSDCTATLDTSTQSIILVGNCSGDIVVTCDETHVQGGVG
jgi:hypothetical protein